MVAPILWLLSQASLSLKLQLSVGGYAVEQTRCCALRCKFLAASSPPLKNLGSLMSAETPPASIASTDAAFRAVQSARLNRRWWFWTIGILLVSPLLEMPLGSPIWGFCLAWFLLVCITLRTPSDEFVGFSRLCAAPLLILGFWGSLLFAATRIGYQRGYQTALEAVAREDEHQFAFHLYHSKSCWTYSPLDIGHIYSRRWKEGVRAGLPPHVGDPRFAHEYLASKGARFSTGWALQGEGYFDDPMTFVPDEKSIVILKGDQFADADLKWLQTFSGRTVKELEIDCPNVTDAGLENLRCLRIERLWITRGHESAVRKLGQAMQEMHGCRMGVNPSGGSPSKRLENAL